MVMDEPVKCSVVMDIEGLKCDLLNVLQNDNDILLKWISSCREFRLRVAARMEERFIYEEDCTKKKSVNTGKISELQQESDRVKSNIDATVLQQKITDKKISNVTKLQEDAKNELEKAKAQRDALSLEIVDLQLELEERKRKKILQWDAIKRACNIYKVNLDIHISLQEEEDCQRIKFSFFIHNEATKDKYFVQLSHSSGHWKIEHIEPKLKQEHFNELSIVKDSSEHSKVPNITLFLSQRIRSSALHRIGNKKTLKAAVHEAVFK